MTTADGRFEREWAVNVMEGAGVYPVLRESGLVISDRRARHCCGFQRIP
jgi:hypothetical protein